MEQVSVNGDLVLAYATQAHTATLTENAKLKAQVQEYEAILLKTRQELVSVQTELDTLKSKYAGPVPVATEGPQAEEA